MNETSTVWPMLKEFTAPTARQTSRGLSNPNKKAMLGTATMAAAIEPDAMEIRTNKRRREGHSNSGWSGRLANSDVDALEPCSGSVAPAKAAAGSNSGVVNRGRRGMRFQITTW